MGTAIVQNATKMKSSEETKKELTFEQSIDKCLPYVMKIGNLQEHQALQYTTNFKLLKPIASQCTGASVMRALLLAVQSQLSPSPMLGELWFIPRTNKNIKGCPKELNFQVGWKGSRKLALRSKEVLSIESFVVYENDHFVEPDYDYTYEVQASGLLLGKMQYEHKPCSGTKGDIKGFYSRVLTRPSSDLLLQRVFYMTKEEVELHRDLYSDSRDKQTGEIKGAWADSFTAMGKKVVITLLCKDLPLEDNISQIFAMDDPITQNAMAEILDQQLIQAGLLEAKPDPVMLPAPKKTTRKKPEAKTEQVTDQATNQVEESEEDETKKVIDGNTDLSELQEGDTVTFAEADETPAEPTRETRPEFCGAKCTPEQQTRCFSEFCINGKATQKKIEPTPVGFQTSTPVSEMPSMAFNPPKTEPTMTAEERADQILAQKQAEQAAPISNAPRVTQSKFIRRNNSVNVEN